MAPGDRVSSLTAEQRALIAGQPVLLLLAEPQRELVVESFVTVEFGFGDAIVRQGEAPDAVWVLAEGRARVVKRLDDGTEVALNRLEPGDMFGEVAVLSAQPRSASVRASGPVVALRLDHSVFAALARLHPAVGEALGRSGQATLLQDFLRLHSAFSVLPRAAIASVLPDLVERTLVPGEVAVREGETDGDVYVIADGRLRVLAGGIVARYLRAGELFGEIAAMDDTPRTATVEAVTEVTLLRVPRERFRALLDEHPEFAQRMRERRAAYAARTGGGIPLDLAAYLTGDEPPELVAGLVAEPADPARGVQLAEPSPDGGAGVPHKTFAHVRQLDEMDCGAACMAMLTRHFGHKVARGHIRQELGTGVDGTSLAALVTGGARLGLEMTAVKVSAGNAETLPKPAIIHWKGNHWLLLLELDDRHAWVADPASRVRRIDRAELAEHWSGYAATAVPTERLAEQPVDRVDVGWLWPFIRPHRVALGISLVLAIVSAALTMLLPVLSQKVVDEVLIPHDAGRLGVLAGGMLALLVVAIAMRLVQGRLLARASVEIDTATLHFVTGKLLRLPLSYFTTRRTGDIERRLSGLQSVRALVVESGIEALTAVTQVVAAVVILLIYSPLLGGAFLATLPIYWAITRVSAVRLRPMFDGLEEAYGRYASSQIDAIKGIETVKARGAEPHLATKMRSSFSALGGRIFRAQLLVAGYGAGVGFVLFALATGFMVLSALLVLDDRLTLGEFLAVQSMFALATGPVQYLLSLWDQAQQASVMLARVQEVFDAKPEQDGAELRPVPSLEGRVTLRRVGFSYPTAPNRPVLTDISLEVAAGTTVALVGRSGSGKSTLVRCLAGLSEATDGTILFDGVPMPSLDYTALRRRIGVVLQQPYLFDDTVAANIAFGEDVVDLAAVREAAQIADAAEFIERLPLGYDTRIGESGLALSGGQAQRVAIARAVYGRPSVLLLDEATSALDTESERAVKQNLDRLLTGRTAFVVAHRLSTIRDADLIVVLEQGRIVETGTHEQLMAGDGLYRYLHNQQLA